jgi:hypothetical protein
MQLWLILSNGYSPQIRETRKLQAQIWRGESHFSHKWPLANVGESGESSQHSLANVGESGESRIFLKTVVLASANTQQKCRNVGEYLHSQFAIAIA